MFSKLKSPPATEHANETINSLSTSQIHKAWIDTFLEDMRDSGSPRSNGGHGHMNKAGDAVRKTQAVYDMQRHLDQDMHELEDVQKTRFYDTAKSKIFALMGSEGTNRTSDIKSGLVLMCILLEAPVSAK